MKKVLLMTAGLLLMPLPAWSQGMSDSDDRRSMSDRRDHEINELLRALSEEGHGGHGGHGGPGRGAGFLLRRGDATVAVRCDPRESMRTCVDLTSQLLEKARSALPSGGGGGGGGGTPGGGGPPAGGAPPAGGGTPPR